MKTLTVDEQKAQDARVAIVNALIKAAADKRLADKVVETPEQTASRLDNEAFLLRDAKGLATPQEKLHREARDARVKNVLEAIAEAAVIRDENEKKGIAETDGVKLDRLAKEAEDLDEASELNVIEPFHVDVNNLEIQIIADKLNEVIDYLNESLVKEDE